MGGSKSAKFVNVFSLESFPLLYLSPLLYSGPLGVLVGCGLGGACNHIKAFGPVLFLSQRKISGECGIINRCA